MADENIVAKDGRFRVVSLAPDVCLTPSKKGVPVPYPITHQLDQLALQRRRGRVKHDLASREIDICVRIDSRHELHCLSNRLTKALAVGIVAEVLGKLIPGYDLTLACDPR